MAQTVVGVAQEVLNPGKWVTAAAAKILVGLSAGTEFYKAANAGEFRKKEAKRPEGRKGGKVVLYLYADLCAYADSVGIVVGDYMRDWLEMIVWADTLAEMPTESEIEANARGKYGYRDMMSLIETRRYRGLSALNSVSYEGDSSEDLAGSVGGQIGNKNRAVLSEEKVADIKWKLNAGVTRTELADEHCVSYSTIKDIDTGKTWGNVSAKGEE